MLTLPSIQESYKHMELTTCLWFDGDAREVANFYVSIFPESSLGISWIAPADTPGNQKGSKVLVNFVIFGRPFIALNGGPNYHFSEAISFQIPCQDQLMINTGKFSSRMADAKVDANGLKINSEPLGK